MNIDELVRKIYNVLEPIIGECEFSNDLTLSYSVGNSAIFINIKEYQGRPVIELSSPVVMNPKINQGMLETLNSYNVEEEFTLAYIEGNVNFIIARGQLDADFFDEKQFSLKLKRLTSYSLALVEPLTTILFGQSFAEFHSK